MDTYRTFIGKLKIWILVFIMILLFPSCSERIDNPENLCVFKNQTIAEYINSCSDFSMFAKVMSKSRNSAKVNSSSVASLLGCRGNFTAFVPDNKAMKAYLDSIYGRDNYKADTLPEDVANKIVLNCVMDFGDASAFKESDLYEGTIQEPTLNEGNFLVKFGNYGTGIFTKVNGSCVVGHDIELSNGYVEVVDKVIDPSAQTLTGLIEQSDSLTIFSKLLDLTSWADSLLSYRNRMYVQPTGLNNFPKNKFFGYMAFVESDRVFHEKWGIPLPERDAEDGHVKNWDVILNSIDKNCKRVYPNALSEDWINADNAVNQFVAYHLVDGKYSFEKLARYSDLYEDWMTKNIQSFYCTKGKYRRLLKVTRLASDGSMMLNRHSYYNNAFDGDYSETSCDIAGIPIHGDSQTYGYNYARNGYYFTLGDVLVYSDEVRHTVLNDRIRYGVTGYLSELSSLDNLYPNGCIIPMGYCDHLITDDDYGYLPSTKMGMEGKALDFSGSNGEGVQDFILTLMPVPFAGNWQVRTNFSTITDFDEINQIYVGDSRILNKMNPVGLPTRNFEYSPEEMAKIYKNDYQLGLDSVLCQENDRQLYVHGFMKGPKFFHHHLASEPTIYDNNKIPIRTSAYTMRDRIQKSRRIIYEGFMEPDKTYYVRVQLKVGQTNYSALNQMRIPILDMIELVPESIYNNPKRQEDIW